MRAVGSLGTCVQASPLLPTPQDHGMFPARRHGTVLSPAPSPFLHREKLDSFLPAHLCKRGHGLFAALRGRGAKAGTGEQGLLNAYRRVQEAAGSDGEREASLSPHYRAYLLKCHELPFYG